MVLDYPFVWPLWNVAENSQRQVCKQRLTLSESTTCDGLCLASDTPQAALRPSYTPPNILARDQLNPYLQAARRKEVEQWQSRRIDPSYGSATASCSGGNVEPEVRFEEVEHALRKHRDRAEAAQKPQLYPGRK